LLLSAISTFVCEISGTANSKMGTGRECDHHVPPIINDAQDITLDVRTISFSWEDVTRNGIVPI
jgi:hypothetical protein